MDHDTVVEDWRQNAERHDEENYEFLRSMKCRDYGFDPDDWLVSCMSRHSRSSIAPAALTAARQWTSSSTVRTSKGSPGI